MQSFQRIIIGILSPSPLIAEFLTVQLRVDHSRAVYRCDFGLKRQGCCFSMNCSNLLKLIRFCFAISIPYPVELACWIKALYS